jgi:alpha,alpha-trehalase
MRRALLVLVFGCLSFPQTKVSARPDALLERVSAAYAKLEPQTMRPPEGYFKYDYLIPAGYYKQMWDWDGFFIGSHLAHQKPENAKYLRGWVLTFAGSIDQEGYVPGIILAEGVPPLDKIIPVLGRFAVKPFLAQGAVTASERSGDYQWVGPVWENLRKIIAYRERTQYDPKWQLFFWETAVQSGEDNNVALTNDPKDRDAILAADLCAFQLREYKAMARLAQKLGRPTEAGEYVQKAETLKAAMLKHLWFAQDQIFFNVRRDSGQPVKRITGSNFIPLIEDILRPAEAQAMIRRYLWNGGQMRSRFGIRSLSKRDAGYNNVSMIVPYSNWQGPVWINTNYLDFLALRRYGFKKEAQQLSVMLGQLVLADIEKTGSMHECYSAETGEGLAPTEEQAKEKETFPGFVGWNLLVQDMLQCEAKGDCLLLDVP